MNNLYIKIGDISYLKFGIATYAIKILSMYPYKVKWNKLYKILIDKRLFNSFKSYNDYLKYVLNISTYGPFVSNINTDVSCIYNDSLKLQSYKEYLVSFDELKYIFSIYDTIILNSIKNVKKDKGIYDFDIDIYIDEIREFYQNTKNNIDSVDNFMKSLECFMQYNLFLFMAYNADFYSNREVITLNFFEEEQGGILWKVYLLIKKIYLEC